VVIVSNQKLADVKNHLRTIQSTAAVVVPASMPTLTELKESIGTLTMFLEFARLAPEIQDLILESVSDDRRVDYSRSDKIFTTAIAAMQEVATRQQQTMEAGRE
jgi:hypothetical protein